MAAVLVSLGFFMISPVIRVLINSFNAAADWFVEPRRWGLDHWHAAYQNPRELLKHGRDRPYPSSIRHHSTFSALRELSGRT
jgi:hypothetical protein